MNIEPIANTIIVLRDPPDRFTLGGIMIPDIGIKLKLEATVIKVGPGKLTEQNKRSSIDLEPGDRVMLSPGAGTPMMYKGVEYFLVREEEVLAKIEEPKKKTRLPFFSGSQGSSIGGGR